MSDFSTMLESKVYHVETDVMAALHEFDIDDNLKACLHEIFSSHQVCDPFYGLQTQHKQKKLFADLFHLLVCFIIYFDYIGSNIAS